MDVQTRNRAYYEANKDAVKLRSKNWKKENREQFNAWAREDRKKWTDERRAKRALVARRAALKALYGISLEQYDELLAKQKGVCAVCFRGNSPRKWLDVDHDHVTGKVRGLLCTPCNRSLGHFDKRIPKLLEYLRGY